MTWLVVAAIALLVLLLAVVGAWAYRTAHRLDRLNVRYDLSWQALDGALARRAVVARAVAIDAYGGATNSPAGRTLAALADAAENAPRHARENAENELSAALAVVDPASLPAGLIAELADAEARVLLARRFHNDAVRDTLALAERRHGARLSARRNRSAAKLFRDRRATARAGAHRSRRAQPPHVGAGGPARRHRRGAVAVRFGSGDHRRAPPPRWWFTVGGEVRPGERLAEAAARELAEETGLHVTPADMVGPIWRRDEVFEFNGSLIDSEEFYLVHRTRRFEPSGAGRTELERRYIHGARWCDANDIAELVAAGEQVYPLQLGELLPALNRVADAPADASPDTQAGVPLSIR